MTMIGLVAKSVGRLVLVCLIISLPVRGSFADELDESQLRLQQIEKQIGETLKGLHSKKTEGGALSEELEQLAIETRRIEQLTNKSAQKLADISERVNKQRQLIAEVDGNRKETEQQIRRRLVVLYKSGEVGLIRVLLSEAESPRDIAEKYAFLSRMVRYDRNLLSTYQQQSRQQREALAELETLRKEQASVVARRGQEQKNLQKAEKRKKILLDEVRQDTKILETMLGELRAKAARLNELLKKLETQQAQTYTENLAGLTAQKGSLLWPVPGRLRVGFGTSRHGDLGTLIESHGFDIEAAVGTLVISSAAGKVIFANTLRGYGKLMIVDHGGKFYTLYAHVARFIKAVGDKVAAAEPLAYSGYEGRDAVYFEIRHRGKPLDPADWLQRR